jgi:hypothetical protein
VAALRQRLSHELPLFFTREEHLVTSILLPCSRTGNAAGSLHLDCATVPAAGSARVARPRRVVTAEYQERPAA